MVSAVTSRFFRFGLRWRKWRAPDTAFFADIHRRLDALLQPAIAFWRRAVDHERGGFYGLVDYDGRALPEADKDFIQQIRHLWTFSYIHHIEDRSPAIAEICAHQFQFIRERFYVPERASFHPSVSADGAPKDGALHHYHLAFGIYALSGYAIAFAETSQGKEALRMAKDVFGTMKVKSYDETHGFDETAYAGRWTTGAKEINTQLHVLEAIAELLTAARAHRDPAASTIANVLGRQLDLVIGRGIVRRGRRYYCSRAYDADWSVIDSSEVDYGHEIELVYLAMAAAALLGRDAERQIVDKLVSLGRCTTEAAYDRVHGKWCYSGNPLTGKVLQRISSFWVNFEALNGLATMYRLTGEAGYLEKFEKVLAWLEAKQINAAVGEWYCHVDDAGRPVDRDVYGNDCAWMSFAWKSSYHSLRALITCKQWIAETYLKGARSSFP
jgi:mannobiose 2-epimerase